MCLFPPPDILVSAGRSGAQVPEPDLLHAGVHRAAVSMCQPLLPQCQVEGGGGGGGGGCGGEQEQPEKTWPCRREAHVDGLHMKAQKVMQ